MKNRGSNGPIYLNLIPLKHLISCQFGENYIALCKTGKETATLKYMLTITHNLLFTLWGGLFKSADKYLYSSFYFIFILEHLTFLFLSFLTIYENSSVKVNGYTCKFYTYFQRENTSSGQTDYIHTWNSIAGQFTYTKYINARSYFLYF